MAHYLGDLIDRAERADESAREELDREISQTVTKLWSIRAGVPVSRPPLERFQKILDVIDQSTRIAMSFSSRRPSRPRGWTSTAEAPFQARIDALDELSRRNAHLTRILLVDLSRRAQSDEAAWLPYLETIDDDQIGLFQLLIDRTKKWSSGDDQYKVADELLELSKWAREAAKEIQATSQN